MNKHCLKKIMGSNLRSIRQTHGLSITALAIQMDVTPGFLGLIERGKRSLTALMLVRASQYFDIPVSSFYQCSEYEENLKVKEGLAE